MVIRQQTFSWMMMPTGRVYNVEVQKSVVTARDWLKKLHFTFYRASDWVYFSPFTCTPNPLMIRGLVTTEHSLFLLNALTLRIIENILILWSDDPSSISRIRHSFSLVRPDLEYKNPSSPPNHLKRIQWLTSRPVTGFWVHLLIYWFTNPQARVQWLW